MVTLTKHRGLSKPDDEQLHVLPMYVLDPTDEDCSYEGQYQKIQNGSLEVLHQYPLELRMRAQPLMSCKKRKQMKKTGKRGAAVNGCYPGWDSSSSAQSTPQKPTHNQGPSNPASIDTTPVKHQSQQHSQNNMSSNRPTTYEDLKSLSTHPCFPAIQEKFWTFYSAYGVFPPASFLTSGLEKQPQKPNPPVQRSAHHDSSYSSNQQSSLNQGYEQRQQHPTMSNNQGPRQHGQPDSVPLSTNMANNTRDSQLPQYNNGAAVQNQFTASATRPSDQRMHPNTQGHSEGMEYSKQQNVHENLPKYGQNQPASGVNRASMNNSGTVTKANSGIPTDGCALDLSFSSTSSRHSVQGSTEGREGIHQERRENLQAGYKSPLDLLSQAVDMRSKDLSINSVPSMPGYASLHRTHEQQNQGMHHPSQTYPHHQNGSNVPSNHHHQQQQQQQQQQPYAQFSGEQRNNMMQYENGQPNAFHRPEAVNHPSSYHPSNQSNQAQPNQPHSQQQYGGDMGQQGLPAVAEQPRQNTPPVPSLIDPDIVKCQMEYNEDAFVDPEIGGVAIALCHGAVLFEVAKRELHATTGLRNPNRYHPTRISLVFYQHKNLNNERHGMYNYKQKLQNMKMKRIEEMQLERGYVDMKEIENSFKGGKKRKASPEDIEEDREIAELLKSANSEYRFMLQCSTGRVDSSTTNTVSTNWVDPSPMVTGPYQKWV